MACEAFGKAFPPPGQQRKQGFLLSQPLHRMRAMDLEASSPKPCSHCGFFFAPSSKYNPWQRYCPRRRCKLHRQRQRMKRQYEERKEQGTCVHCGDRKAREGSVRCRPCNQEKNRIRREWHHSNKEEGRCWQCGEELEPCEEEGTYCDGCRRAMRFYRHHGDHNMYREDSNHGPPATMDKLYEVPT
jgi:hypothetical protein